MPILALLNWLEVYAIAIDTHNPKVIYIAMPKGVYKSTNGGKKWTLKNEDVGFIYPPLALDPNNPSIIYSKGNGDLYDIFIKSSNSGKSWKFANNGTWIKTSKFGDFNNDDDDDDDDDSQSCELISSITVDPKNSSILYLGDTV